MIKPITIDLDPDWTVMRRFTCGHVQHSCCKYHLDTDCPLCTGEDTQ